MFAVSKAFKKFTIPGIPRGTNTRFYVSEKGESQSSTLKSAPASKPLAVSSGISSPSQDAERDQKATESKSKLSAFFASMSEKFNQTRRAEEKKALEKKKITAEQAAKASSFFEAPQSKTMDLQSRILAQDALETAYYRHARQVAKTGSKFWTAASQLTPLQKAKRIPEISGGASGSLEEGSSSAVMYAASGKPFSLLQARLGKKCTLVGFFFNQFGEKHVVAYMNAFQDEFGQDGVGRAGLVEISVVEQAVKTPLLKVIRPYISWTLSPERKVFLYIHGIPYLSKLSFSIFSVCRSDTSAYTRDCKGIHSQ